MIKIKNFTELDTFFTWKKMWEFLFDGCLDWKSIVTYNISFKDTYNLSFKDDLYKSIPGYLYYLNNNLIDHKINNTKKDLVLAIKDRMKTLWFKEETNEVNNIVTSWENINFDWKNEFSENDFEKEQIEKTVKTMRDHLDYFFNGKGKLEQIKENKWRLSYKYLHINVFYKILDISYFPEDEVFSISWSWITWTEEQRFFDIVCSEKYRNNIIFKYDENNKIFKQS